MTREEALRIWLPIVKIGVESIQECREAVDMAIKALEQESCDKCVYSTKDGYCQYDDITETIPPLKLCEDCISKEYILSKAHCCCNDLADDELCCVDVDDIKEAPSVQPKPKTDVLDKIRAEIQEYADNKAEPMEMRAYYHCLQIIDKYKAESEDKE